MSDDIPVIPEEVPEFTGNLELLDQHISGIRSAGTSLKDSGSAIDTRFGGLSAYYKAPEADQLFATTAPVAAKDYVQGSMRIEHPSARPTPPGARTGGVYFTLHNAGTQADRLVRVASPAADTAELHSMTMDGNVMRMRAVPAIGVPSTTSGPVQPFGVRRMIIGQRGRSVTPWSRASCWIAVMRSWQRSIVDASD